MRASHRAKASLAALCVIGIGPCGSAWAQQNDAAATPQQVSAVPVLPDGPAAQTAQLPPPPSPPMVDMPAAEIDLWPNGRLLRIRCGGLSIVETVCRYGDFTGIANTYHPNGSVAESLTFVGGILEGLVESYDPVGHLLSRRLFHVGKPLAPGQNVSQIPLGKDPPLPPPPTFDPQVSSLPAGTPEPPSPATSDSTTPPFGGLVGIGGSLQLGVLANQSIAPLAIGGQFLLIPNTGRLRPEFRAGAIYFSQTDYRRLDVPLSLGLQFDLFAAPSSLYVGAALLTQYARRFLPTDIPSPSIEDGWLLGGEGIVGLRVQRARQSYWLFDVRMGGSGRVDSQPQLLRPQADGPPEPAMGRQFQLLFGISFVGLV